MEIHNMTEDWVIAKVNSVCDSIEKENLKDSICTCDQCRQDTVCYVLNRTTPYYVVSHRGVTRANQESFTTQQNQVDLTTLVYEGIKLVSHNQRSYANHDRNKHMESDRPATPVFNIPAVMGRVFNGLNFSPAVDSVVELFQNGKLVEMKDSNWQNPYKLIANTNGAFTFWPKPQPALTSGLCETFHFVLKVSGGKFEALNYSFSITVTSDPASSPFSLENTHKIPDLHLFPPGEEEAQRIISE
jgi:competence protein ComFB